LLAASAYIPVLFGASWQPTGMILRAMLPFFVIEFAVSPTMMTAVVQGRQRMTMLWQISLLVLALISAWAAVHLALSMRSYILLSGALHGGACLVFHWLCYASLPRAERETQPQRRAAARLEREF
jgi:O-antigen/teichoic acid export membrane protein